MSLGGLTNNLRIVALHGLFPEPRNLGVSRHGQCLAAITRWVHTQIQPIRDAVVVRIPPDHYRVHGHGAQTRFLNRPMQRDQRSPGDPSTPTTIRPAP